MPVTQTGATENVALLEGQRTRLLNPQAAFDAADRDLAQVRRAHPTWRTPGSWYTRFLDRLERYVRTGAL